MIPPRNSAGLMSMDSKKGVKWHSLFTNSLDDIDLLSHFHRMGVYFTCFCFVLKLKFQINTTKRALSTHFPVRNPSSSHNGIPIIEVASKQGGDEDMFQAKRS